LAESLRSADRTFCYTANLGWDAATALGSLGNRATCEMDLEHLIAAIVAEAKPGDQVLVMSNGGFGDIQGRLLAELGKRVGSGSLT
jgi:UDP-N-acetylmuramate: L-alanyl-gamma-D-glutamyl-meso-diaminopimelate ligase